MRDFETMEMVCARAEEALRETARKADFMKPGDVEVLKDLVGLMYKCECLLEDGGGYSGNYYSYSREGGSGMMGGEYSRASNNYEGGSSYARRRDSMGRYSRRGYSRDGVMDHLDAMMQEADTEEKREKIRRFREQLM